VLIHVKGPQIKGESCKLERYLVPVRQSPSGILWEVKDSFPTFEGVASGTQQTDFKLVILKVRLANTVRNLDKLFNLKILLHKSKNLGGISSF